MSQIVWPLSTNITPLWHCEHWPTLSNFGKWLFHDAIEKISTHWPENVEKAFIHSQYFLCVLESLCMHGGVVRKNAFVNVIENPVWHLQKKSVMWETSTTKNLLYLTIRAYWVLSNKLKNNRKMAYFSSSIHYISSTRHCKFSLGNHWPCPVTAHKPFSLVLAQVWDS